MRANESQTVSFPSEMWVAISAQPKNSLKQKGVGVGDSSEHGKGRALRSVAKPGPQIRAKPMVLSSTPPLSVISSQPTPRHEGPLD